ncbi:MAG: GtrA family protein [Lachnospiraceae bacterium]
MIQKLWNKFVNRETVSYFIFGVLTTLVDWVSYALMRQIGWGYQAATAGSWAAAVLFAYVTNKLFVFQSYDRSPGYLMKELASFVGFRALSGVFTFIAMVVMVDGIGIKNDYICKVVVSGLSLVLNYVFSKIFIFKKEKE